MTKSVCIVGAGPSGLVAAKSLLHNAPKGEFSVSVFDARDAIGGLWPASKADMGRQVHPLMVANQSKHTMQFSDLAWEDGVPQMPRAWMVGRYLERYLDRYLTGNPGFELRLGSRVTRAEKRQDGGRAGWAVHVQSGTNVETRDFDYLLVASGYFGKPLIPECFKNTSDPVPIIHSSQYRDLKGLLGDGSPEGGKILVVGGQMSGVETASTIASHLSSALNSPDESSASNMDNYSVYHVIQRPIWVLPLYTSPEPTYLAAPFMPLDFSSYNLNNRAIPLENNQGHITEDTANQAHAMFEDILGSQEDFCPLLQPDEEAKTEPPYLSVSDWYCDFVRSGAITLSQGKVMSLENKVATLELGGSMMDDIAAVVLATGFDPSPCLSFLPEETRETLQHSPQHPDQALALAFHGTHHPDVPNLGFVGFYRSPYWGVMQMQSRLLADLWSDQKGPKSEPLCRKLEGDDSINRTLSLRGDPRLSQFPMGDYMYLMQDLAEALSIEMHPPLVPHNSVLSRNRLPLDMVTPARYPSPSDDAQAKAEADKSLKETRDLTVECLTTPRFVARAVFRSLLGEWRLDRQVTSRLSSHPSGRFIGMAKFLLRERTSDGIQCATNPASPSSNDGADDDYDDMDLEYLYVEDGEFTTDSGFGFNATRRYIWRYHAKTDRISVWFAKTDHPKRADYLFHEIEFSHPEDESHRDEGWSAMAGHLCIDDYYDVKYKFPFNAVNLSEWTIEYTVNGPKKDYTIQGTYARI